MKLFDMLDQAVALANDVLLGETAYAGVVVLLPYDRPPVPVFVDSDGSHSEATVWRGVQQVADQVSADRWVSVLDAGARDGVHRFECTAFDRGSEVRVWLATERNAAGVITGLREMYRRADVAPAASRLCN